MTKIQQRRKKYPFNSENLTPSKKMLPKKREEQRIAFNIACHCLGSAGALIKLRKFTRNHVVINASQTSIFQPKERTFFFCRCYSLFFFDVVCVVWQYLVYIYCIYNILINVPSKWIPMFEMCAGFFFWCDVKLQYTSAFFMFPCLGGDLLMYFQFVSVFI